MPAVMLTLSVLLCVGALSDASAVAAARSLQQHATTASERETVATLLLSLNEAARKLCRHHHTGPALATTQAPVQGLIGQEPAALRPYEPSTRRNTRTEVLDHLLNLPPPAATL